MIFHEGESMKKVLSLVLALTLSLLSIPVQAQPAVSQAGSGTAAGMDELLNMLPSSDLVAVVDIGRAFNDLLPRLSEVSVGGIDQMAKDIKEFTAKTGIDPSRINKAVIGFKMNGLQGSGAIIIDGLDVDGKMIESGMKSYKAEFKTMEYKGKQIYTLISRVNSPTAGPLSVKTDEMAIASLGEQKTVLGDINAVKEVLDIQSGSAKTSIAPTMISALKETRENALLRFALNIPDDLRKEATSQGDLFKSVSTIKYILGTFDVATDFSLALDAVMRTTSQNDAVELETGLKGLVGLIKGFFGGGDPKTDIFGQLIDQIKIGSKLSDVSVSIALPRSFMDQISKKPEPAKKQ